MGLNNGAPARRGNLWRTIVGVLVAGLLVAAAGGWWLARSHVFNSGRMSRLMSYLGAPQDRTDWQVQAGQRCAGAPFQMPTSGYIGFLWGDSFRIGHNHQGIDIFGGEEIGQAPVYAAYAGYLTRLQDWKSTVIVRVPDDPLQPGRQIWTYYTHMAGPQGDSYIAAAYPPGSSEIPVEAGSLLGYQGNFSGSPDNPTGVHLHFSIVLDDGSGSFRNELEIENTVDPSAYLGLPLNARANPDAIPLCGEE